MTAAASVVITCYNLERYIGEAIESVLSQTAAGLEIVVVDDCSTDGSAERIASYSGVRYVRTPQNSGVLLATITGVEAASSDLILFLDGDDLWRPTKAERILEAFEADPKLALVTHDLVYVDAEGRPLDRPTRPCEEFSAVPPGQWPELVRTGILDLGDFIWLGSALAVRRSTGRVAEFCAWARALPDPRNTYQDWPLAYWIAALPRARCAYIPEKLFRYRLHALNYSGDASSLEKALRNVRRTLNTSEAMKAIATLRNLPRRTIERAQRQADFYHYLESLYLGRRWAATCGFFRGFRFASNGRAQLVKELSRFGGIMLLGPRRFISLTHRRDS
jgi:glycosyltransferase involved in cell wall biosynthesis